MEYANLGIWQMVRLKNFERRAEEYGVEVRAAVSELNFALPTFRPARITGHLPNLGSIRM